MRSADLISEAFAGLVERPTQAAVTAIATAVGIGTLVSTIAIAQTAGNQFITHVGTLASTDIVASIGQPTYDTTEPALTWQAPDSVMKINGVIAAGAIAEITGAHVVRTSPLSTPESLAAHVRIFAATPGLLDAVGAQFTAGRPFDDGHAARADPVVLVGTAAASQLGVRPSSSPQAIFLDDQPLIVMGTFHTRIVPELTAGIIVTGTYASAYLGPESPRYLHVATESGATELVARQLGLALLPHDPQAVDVTYGPQPTRTTGRIAEDVDALLLLLGGLSLLVASFGIANTSLVTVLQRTPEIGLRRALGFRRRHIGTIFLLESAILGAIGGTFGASGGLIATVITSAIRDWTPILDLWHIPASIALGVIVGTLAGAYPAARAMIIEPVAALTQNR